MEIDDEVVPISPVYKGGDDTAILPDDFFEETNWESPSRPADDSESVVSSIKETYDKEADDIDDKVYSMRDVLKIVAFSKSILNEKIGMVPIKEEKQTPPCVKTEQNISKSRIPGQLQKSAEGKRNQVYKRDYCIISPDNLKSLEKIQFSLASKHKNENLDKLYNILGDLGLLTMIKGQRKLPVISASSTLGYTEAHILFRKELSETSDKFLDDTTQFDPFTHTLMVPIHDDDMLCYQADLQSVKRVVNTVFDPQLLLSARQLLVANKILDAFHYLIKKIRGTKQSDIALARAKYDSYIRFDQSVEVSVALNSLAILQNELVFALSGDNLAEDQMLRKLHQCAFNDERSTVHQAVLHSIGIKSTYQETATYLVEVMERLPIDKQTISANSMNAMDTKFKQKICFAYRDSKCVRADCRFLHDSQDSKGDPVFKSRDQSASKGGGKDKEMKKTGGPSSTASGPTKKAFKVNLTSADRQYIGQPKGKASMHNMEGWSHSQMKVINHLIAANDNPSGESSKSVDSHHNSYYDEETPDQIYDHYVNKFQSSQHGTMKSKINAGSKIERSHHMNSFRVESSDLDYNSEHAVDNQFCHVYNIESSLHSTVSSNIDPTSTSVEEIDLDHSCIVCDVDNRHVLGDVICDHDVANVPYFNDVNCEVTMFCDVDIAEIVKYYDDVNDEMYNEERENVCNADIDEIVQYYYEETHLRLIKCMFTSKVTSALVNNRNISVYMSMCIGSEMFPITVLSSVVEHMMSFIVVNYSVPVYNDVCGGEEENNLYNQMYLQPTPKILRDDYYDPYDIYNEGDDVWNGYFAESYEEWERERVILEQEEYDIQEFSQYNNFICDETPSMNHLRQDRKKPLIDSGASLCGTNDISLLIKGSIQPCQNMTVTGPFGGAGISPDVQGDFSRLGLNMIHMEGMSGTLLAVSAICDGGKAQVEQVCVFTKNDFHAYPLKSVMGALKNIESCQPTMSGTRRNNLYELDDGYSPPSNEIQLFLMDIRLNLCNVKNKSLYQHVHRILGHPGRYGMNWHRKNSPGAQFTPQDAERTRDICPACAQGKMRKVGTDHHREHREEPMRTGLQFSVDCYTHSHSSRNGYLYADSITDLASRRVFVLFTIGRTADEVIANFEKFFSRHPEWSINRDPSDDAFFRCDREPAYMSQAFATYMATKGYRIEEAAPRDKHGMGVSERSVGLLEEMSNTVMMATHCPQELWSYAFTYAADTMSYNYNSAINTSSYTYISGNNLDISKVHGFLDKCWVLIEPGLRDSKVGSPRAYKGCFLGYVSQHMVQFSLVMVIAVTSSGKFGKIGISKDVLYDNNIDFRVSTEGEEPYQREWEDKDSYIPSSYRENAPLLLRGPAQQVPRITPPEVTSSTRVLRSKTKQSLYSSLPLVKPVKRVGPKVNPFLPPPTEVIFDEDDPEAVPVYWNSMIGTAKHIEEDEDDSEYHRYLDLIEVTHFNLMNMSIDSRVPKNFDEAMSHSNEKWALSTQKEQGKFEDNVILEYVQYVGQPLQRFQWLWNIKENGDEKARLVILGNRMVAGRDFNPEKTYCGNVSSGSFKIATAIAAKYKLIMKKGDLVGAYLIPLPDPDYPIYAHTPEGWVKRPGQVMRIKKNVYGAPPAGNIFANHVEKIVLSQDFLCCAFDPKFFWQWIDGLPVLFILHSDDFIMYLRLKHMYVWEKMLKAMGDAGYGIQDRDGHDFVGVTVTTTEDGGYTLNQRQAIEKTIQTLQQTGAKAERQPYPSVQVCPESLSLKDNLSNFPDLDPKVQKECKDYKYRSAVGALLYIMIYTVPTIMFILNVLSRYCNDPGPRHVFFMQHLIRYMISIRFDEIKYTPHDGPYDIETMTEILQLKYYVDADHAGDKDKLRSQSCYICYLGDCIISWNSTRQNSLSTGSADSEIKAINHTLKTSIISNVGLMNAIGFKQKPVVVYEDNMAAVFAARQPNMTKGLRHMELSEMYFKEKQEEGVIKVTKIGTKDNLADLGTKRLAWPDFAKFASALVVCKNSFFKVFFQKQ